MYVNRAPVSGNGTQFLYGRDVSSAKIGPKRYCVEVESTGRLDGCCILCVTACEWNPYYVHIC